MVEAKCVLFFLVSFIVAFDSVCSFHPVAMSLSHSENEKTDDASPEHSSGESDELRSPNTLSYEGGDIRFGKSSNPMASALYWPTESEEISQEDKRAARNFLRFGRGPQRNFLRFGKSSPMEFGLGLEGDSSEEFSKRAYGNNNFLRFGKASSRNFLRFGRSVPSEKNNDCEDCLLEGSHAPSEQNLPSSLLSKKRNMLDSPRPKRSLSAFYDDVEFVPHTPLSWTAQYAGLIPEGRIVTGQADTTNNGQKKSFNRSFLRYGRNPLDLHFLRFGKRGTAEDESNYEDDPLAREIRARSSKNFLRFG